MKVEVLLTYKDDTTVKIRMEKDKLQDFIKDLHSSAIHYNENTGIGFWTSSDQLKHIIIQKIPDELTQENTGSILTVQKRDDVSCGGDCSSEGEGNYNT